MGKNLQDAMNQVRKDLGSDALIISTMEENTGVRVTAAVENKPPLQEKVINETTIDVAETIVYLLEYHRIPSVLSEKILEKIEKIPSSVVQQGIKSVFSSIFNLQTQDSDAVSDASSPIMLIGPPGAGKTVTMGKLAASYLLKNKKIAVISMDTLKAGGLSQLQTYTSALNVPFFSASNLDELNSLVQHHGSSDTQIIIDTTGMNPFYDSDMNYISQLVVLIKTAPIMVIPAAMDVFEAIDILDAAKALGVTSFIHTKIDLSSRLTTLFGLLSHSNLSLQYLSASPYLGDLLIKPSGFNIAQLILEKTNKDKNNNSQYQAAGGNRL
jgi:flagellar biosynthesis protein FlhF